MKTDHKSFFFVFKFSSFIFIGSQIYFFWHNIYIRCRLMHTQTRVYQTFFVVVVVVWKNFVVVVVDPKIEYCQLGGNVVVVILMKIKHFHLWWMIWRRRKKTVQQFDNLGKSKVRKERKNERISNKKQFKAVQELLFTSKKTRQEMMTRPYEAIKKIWNELVWSFLENKIFQIVVVVVVVLYMNCFTFFSTI